ncbi:MAG: SAM-dependent methyltransferase [Bacteroidota bacterium]
MPNGKLYLIPTPLGPEGGHVLPEHTLAIARSLKVFIVEKGKVSRQLLKQIGLKTPLQQCQFFELNKFTEIREIPSFLDPATEEGLDIGLLSDAGAPGVADPGAQAVMAAHRKGVEVIPLVGPSAILLSLMASGLNGQRFTFLGYLSPKRPQLAKDLKRLEKQSQQLDETQLFIEAPYRNMGVYETAMQVLSPSTLFCIATDLTLSTQFVRTHSILEWRRLPKPNLNKRPTMFLLLGRK